MRRSPILLLAMLTGCGTSDPTGALVQAGGGGGGGAENCTPTFTVSVPDGVLSASLKNAFNAWKNANTTVTASGSVTDTCGFKQAYANLAVDESQRRRLHQQPVPDRPGPHRLFLRQQLLPPSRIAVQG